MELRKNRRRISARCAILCVRIYEEIYEDIRAALGCSRSAFFSDRGIRCNENSSEETRTQSSHEKDCREEEILGECEKTASRET